MSLSGFQVRVALNSRKFRIGYRAKLRMRSRLILTNEVHMRMTADELRQQWRSEPGSQMATLLGQLDQRESEYTRLKDLLAQRQAELGAVQYRLSHFRPDADPLAVAQDLLLKSVLPEMIGMVKDEISTAQSEESKVRSRIANAELELSGERAEQAATVYLRTPRKVNQSAWRRCSFTA